MGYEKQVQLMIEMHYENWEGITINKTLQYKSLWIIDIYNFWRLFIS